MSRKGSEGSGTGGLLKLDVDNRLVFPSSIFDKESKGNELLKNVLCTL